MAENSNPIFYRPKQARKLLGIGNTKFWELIKTGKLEARKLGSATVITADSLHEFADTLPKLK